MIQARAEKGYLEPGNTEIGANNPFQKALSDELPHTNYS